MPQFNLSKAFALVSALVDYAIKAMYQFRLTEEGRDEWLDIEAAARDLLGDEVAAEEARSEAAEIRATERVSQPDQQSRRIVREPKGE